MTSRILPALLLAFLTVVSISVPVSSQESANRAPARFEPTLQIVSSSALSVWKMSEFRVGRHDW
jgi:hypothetical protein